MSEQAAWLDQELVQSDARWRIGTMHHPIYSSRPDRDNPEKRQVLLPVLLKHWSTSCCRGTTTPMPAAPGSGWAEPRPAGCHRPRAGHDHVRQLSVRPQAVPAQRGWLDRYAPTGVTLERMAENTQFYQVISIEGDELHYAAHTADGALYAEVRLRKSAEGAKMISSDEHALPPPRRFEGTLPYESVNG